MQSMVLYLNRISNSHFFSLIFAYFQIQNFGSIYKNVFSISGDIDIFGIIFNNERMNLEIFNSWSHASSDQLTNIYCFQKSHIKQFCRNWPKVASAWVSWHVKHYLPFNVYMFSGLLIDCCRFVAAAELPGHRPGPDVKWPVHHTPTSWRWLGGRKGERGVARRYQVSLKHISRLVCVVL